MDQLSTASFIPESFQGAGTDIATQLALFWSQIRAPLIVPLLNLAVVVCLTMSIMLFIERVYIAIVIVLVKLFGRKPEKRYKWEPMKDDIELGNSAYPMVLVQIPMYNEREVIFFPIPNHFVTQIQHLILHFTIIMQVYQLSIGAACGLSWPSDRIIIQVLDDSTDPAIKVIQKCIKI